MGDKKVEEAQLRTITRAMQITYTEEEAKTLAFNMYTEGKRTGQPTHKTKFSFKRSWEKHKKK